MTVGPLVLELIAAFCIAFILLYHYGKIRTQHALVTVATLVSWYFSLIIVFILPLDVSSTFYRQCLSNIDGNASPHTSTTSMISEIFNGNTNTDIALKVHGNDINKTTSASYNINFTHHNTTAVINVTIFGSNISSAHATENPIANGSVFPTNQTPHFSNTSQITENDDNHCVKPWSFVPANTLPSMWRIVYWTSQILTWFVLPFMQSYSNAGDFSVVGKIKRAVIENAFYYGSYLIIFILLLIYVAANPDINLNFAQLKILLITASNTWGLFLLVLLLGYGLVEVPRNIWDASSIDKSLSKTYFRLAKMSTEKQEAIEGVDDVLEEVQKISSSVKYNHPSRTYVDVIISKCPEDFRRRVSRGMDDYEDYHNSLSNSSSEKTLVRLHRKVIRTTHTQTRTNIQWARLMKEALHLENVKNNMKSLDKTWHIEFPHREKTDQFKNICCNPSSLWYWYCIIQPNLRKLLAVSLAVLSVMVVWSECTFFTQSPVLSLFAVFITLAKKNYDYFYIELASCLIISYLCVCAYYTVFRIKFFNYYYIARHHQTDESSLLFVGIMLCRLTAPLCLNFLGMIHLDTHIAGETGVETSYTKIMGHLDVISIISDGFNIYFPILVCVLCTATYFNLGQRCLSVIGFQRFLDASDEMTSDMIDEGKQLVNREKRRLQREVHALHRAEWKNEYGSDRDMKSRQWHGKAMQDAEIEARTSVNRSSHLNNKKTDKLELLDNMEATDYSSTKNFKNAVVDDLVWEKPPRFSSVKNPLSSRPPKNLFDDV